MCEIKRYVWQIFSEFGDKSHNKRGKKIGAIFQAVKMVHVFSKDGPTLVGGVVVKKLQRA